MGNGNGEMGMIAGEIPVVEIRGEMRGESTRGGEEGLGLSREGGGREDERRGVGMTGVEDERGRGRN